MSGLVEDQTAVMEWLGDPSTHGGADVERVETHAACVFLAGDRAYKLKRAVRFDYLDFSTAELRRAACEAECRLNRRTAPRLYRAVLAVTREPDGRLAFDGDGTPVDYVLEMTRFPQEALLDRRAAAGELDIDLMTALARAVAAFHAEAEARRDHGGHAGMAWVIDGNADGFAEFGGDVLDAAAVARLTDASRAALERHRALLEARREAGLVRHCHGDLHLRNIVLLDGEPTPFDGVEFNDAIACIDVLYDLAFLLMDLWRRELPRHANVVLDAYLDAAASREGLELLPLFLSCRAAVRAKTSATAAALQEETRERERLYATAREYLSLAERLLAPAPPCLVGIGGLSGTGKSTIARGLAPDVGPVPGALVLRSDAIRKQLLNVPRDQHLDASGYTLDVSRHVYDTLAQQAGSILRQGHAVIVDAVHQREDDRGALEAIAAEAGVPFVGVWLDAPEHVLIQRVAHRRADISDADPAVVRAQHTRDIGHLTWPRVDATGSPDEVLARVRAATRTILRS